MYAYFAGNANMTLYWMTEKRLVLRVLQTILHFCFCTTLYLPNFNGVYCLLCRQRNYDIVLNYEKATILRVLETILHFCFCTMLYLPNFNGVYCLLCRRQKYGIVLNYEKKRLISRVLQTMLHFILKVVNFFSFLINKFIIYLVGSSKSVRKLFTWLMELPSKISWRSFTDTLKWLH